MTSPRAASFSARASVAVCAWGFLVAKLAALVLDVAGGARLLVIPAFLTGFLGDVVVLAVVAALARLTRRLSLVVAALLGLYACANVYLVAAYGSPLTAPMLAYRKDADTAVLAAAPLAAGLVAIAVFAVGAWPASRIAARVLTSRRRALLGGAVLVVLGAIGAVAPALDGDGAVRALGLDRNAVALMVRTALVDPALSRDDVRRAWDAAWPAPADARFTAPVEVTTANGRPKHIVVWLAESTGARHTSLYGGPANSTPTLERLRAHSLRFTDYDANTPISAKAIFATLCGFYPSPEAAFETRTNPRIACPSLMETLTKSGWDAALFHGGYFAFTDKMSFLEERGFDTMLDGESVPDRDRYAPNGWGVDDQAIVDHGIAWLDAHQGPSLAVYIPLHPHYEYFMPPRAPKPFGDTLYGRYENGVFDSDRLFGEVVDAYEKRGLLDDTLFVFLGDHGEAFEEHPRNKLHAGFLYEENVHAPLVLFSTKLFAHEEVSARLGSHVDLAATLLDLVGVAVPPETQGQSLVSDAYRYRPILLDTWYPDPLVGLRDGDKKYIRNLQSGVDELYDLARDPKEKHNVAAVFPDAVREYRARLADFVVRQRAFVDGHAHLGPEFLDRAFASMTASIVDEAGVAHPCARAGDRISCGDPDVWIGVVPERSFNMDRRCLRASPPTRGTLALSTTTTPALRTVGVALTDKARLSHGDPLHAKFTVAGGEPFELVVDDVFETTSKARALSASPAPTSVTVELSTGVAKRENRAACITLAP